MARIARVVITDLAHHVTQRGDGRQFILADDAGRMVYLDLLRQAVRAQQVSVLGYCLMSNHVHVVAIPRRPGALAEAFHRVHGRYASYWNVAHAGSGHVWQGRFYSCPMEAGHLWRALRYTELNPVRAGLVAEAAQWPWSSAAAHCGTGAPDECLDMATWRQQWSESTWRTFLQQGETDAELLAIRRATQSGRPLGSAEFIKELESGTQRRLTPQKGGRPRKNATKTTDRNS
jgi:putative transposase